MDAIMDSLIKIAALVILLAGSYLVKQFSSYLKDNNKEMASDALDKLIDELVRAAEQMFKKDDPSGSTRLDYVEGMLIAEGYDLTETIRAQIESKVFQINLEQRGDAA